MKNIDARFNALHDMLHDFHSGLTKTEATTIYDLFVLELKDGETGMEKLMNLTSGKAQRETRVQSNENNLEDITPPNSSPLEFNNKSITASPTSASRFKRLGHMTKDQMRRNKKKALAATAATLHANYKISLKKDLSQLIELVTTVRRATIQRNIMRQMNPLTCSKMLLNRILEIRESMINVGRSRS